MSNHPKFWLGGGLSAVRTSARAIARHLNRWQAQRLLAEIYKHELRDIGLCRAEARVWSERLRSRFAQESDAEKCRRALRRLREDQLNDLSETGLIARRMARRV